MLHFIIQDSVGLLAANKLTKDNVNFQNQKMKVSLAAQVLSQSVASSLKLGNILDIPAFTNEDCLSTAAFLRLEYKSQPSIFD